MRARLREAWAPLASVAFPACPRPLQSAQTLPPLLCACRVYQSRKGANGGKGDIVFNQLVYDPVCTHMPVCAKCENPKFIWRKKH